MTKQLIINGMRDPVPNHVNIGLTSYPGEQGTERWGDLDFWIEQAKILDNAGIHGIFLSDVLGDLDVYKGRRDETLRAGNSVPGDDPFVIAAALFAETRNLGVVVTGSTSYEHPYVLARRFSTLDRLSRGRVGWNIVTSATDSAARNIGRSQQLEHDERYDLADEFVDVTYKLWQYSWDPSAVKRDRGAGIYADASHVHEIGHQGKYFSVPGVHHTEPTRQRTPVIYQAGTSSRGVEFAGTHAEGIFLTAPSPEQLKGIVERTRAAAVAAGRDPASLKFLPAFNFFVDDTDAEARRKYLKYQKYVWPEGGLARFSGFVGYDVGGIEPDAPIEHVDVQGFRGFFEFITQSDPNRKWTPNDLGEYFAWGDITPSIVGSPQTIVDEIERWIRVADIDGITILETPSPGQYLDFVSFILPELRRRGLFTPVADGASFRETHYGPGVDEPRADHPAAAYSWTRHPEGPEL